MRALLRTDDSLPLMIVRLALGIVMLPHGLQKALGLFGGPGYSGTMAMFTSQGMPAALAFLIILGESAGSLGLIVGFRLFRPLQTPPPVYPLRQSAFNGVQYRYINPLLGVNLPQTEKFPKLRRASQITFPVGIHAVTGPKW